MDPPVPRLYAVTPLFLTRCMARSPPLRELSYHGINDTSVILSKRHGWSSGMRHGWRSSWWGVRTPVRLSVQGPAGEASATAPFSNPLHQWYRRWMGGVSRPHSFFSLWYVTDLCQLYLRGKQKSKASATTHLQQRAPPPVPPCAAGTASPPHTPSQLAC